jgi:hypothetical protein
MIMMNVKETLKRLHKRLPTLSLDELFELLDCYVEEYTTNIDSWQPKIWYYDNKIDTMPLKTNGIQFNKHSISCSTSNKNGYDGNTTTTAKPSFEQFTTSY